MSHVLSSPQDFRLTSNLSHARSISRPCFISLFNEGNLVWRHKGTDLDNTTAVCVWTPRTWVSSRIVKRKEFSYRDTNCKPGFYLCGVHPVALFKYTIWTYNIYICNPQSQLFLFVCHLTTCFGPYRPSSGEKCININFCFCENHHATLNTSLITCYFLLLCY
jgi:hypothetical protein